MRQISGHVRIREGKRGAVWYGKYRGPVKLPDGEIVSRQTETKIGPAWTGSGRTPDGYFTKRSAQAWLDAKLTDLRRGIGIPTGGPAATFADAAADWYRKGLTEADWKPSTRRDYRSALHAHLGVDLDPAGNLLEAREPFGDLRLSEISTETITRWRANRMAEGQLPRRMAVKTVAMMHGIFERARAAPYNLSENPVADVGPLKDRYGSGRTNFYSVEEVWALVRAAESDQDAAIFLTAALTGLRMGELLGLHIRDVDFEGETIRVLQSVDPIEGVHTTKSDEGRGVPMAHQVAQALARLLQRDHFTGPDDFVFPSETGRWLDSSALRRRYKEAQTRAELRPLKFHELRHTFGTVSAADGQPLTDIQKWMGHASIKTTMRYLHYAPRKDSARRLGEAFTVKQPVPADQEREEAR